MKLNNYLKDLDEIVAETLGVTIPPHPGGKYAKPQKKEIEPEGGVVKNEDKEKELVELFLKMRPGGEWENKKIDLCDFHLGGSLFCGTSLPIPRLNMPQLSAGSRSLADLFNEWTRTAQGEVIPDYSALIKVAKNPKDKINMSDVKARIVSAPAVSLKATQQELNGEKISGMVQALAGEGFKKTGTVKGLYDPLVVSEDLYIVDGHHRWAALVLADVLNKAKDSPITLKVYQIPLNVVDIMALAYPHGPFDQWLQEKYKLNIDAPKGFNIGVQK